MPIFTIKALDRSDFICYNEIVLHFSYACNKRRASGMSETAELRRRAIKTMDRYPVKTSYYSGGTVPVTFRMPPEVKEAFFETARELRLNPSGLLRQMVTEWLSDIEDKPMDVVRGAKGK
jgi:hypothetical protein